MSDFAEDAERTEELHRSIALKARKPTGPAACGACHYCLAIVDDGMRWCDSSCRDDWEKANAR